MLHELDALGHVLTGDAAALPSHIGIAELPLGAEGVVQVIRESYQGKMTQRSINILIGRHFPALAAGVGTQAGTNALSNFYEALNGASDRYRIKQEKMRRQQLFGQLG